MELLPKHNIRAISALVYSKLLTMGSVAYTQKEKERTLVSHTTFSFFSISYLDMVLISLLVN